MVGRFRRAMAIIPIALSAGAGIGCSPAAPGRASNSDAADGPGRTTPSPGDTGGGVQAVVPAPGGVDSDASGTFIDAGGGAATSVWLGGNGVGASIDAGTGAGLEVETGTVDSGATTPDASGAGATADQSFVCSQVMGLELTDQWYTAGFETAPGIEDARWQIVWKEHAYIDEWANPNSTFWAIPPMSPCTQESNSPDRVLLVALSWTIVTLAEWETNVQQDINNIKAKYPNVRQIVLMTIVRGPGNISCGDTTVVAENTLIPAYVDQALAEVATGSPDLVKVAPKFAASACTDFMETGPHLTAAGDAEMAQKIAAAYANQ
jgi:hypothetical protein